MERKITLVGGPLDGQTRVMQGSLFQYRNAMEGLWETYLEEQTNKFNYFGKKPDFNSREEALGFVEDTKK